MFHRPRETKRLLTAATITFTQRKLKHILRAFLPIRSRFTLCKLNEAFRESPGERKSTRSLNFVSLSFADEKTGTLDGALDTLYCRSQMYLSRQMSRLRPQLTMPIFSGSIFKHQRDGYFIKPFTAHRDDTSFPNCSH